MLQDYAWKRRKAYLKKNEVILRTADCISKEMDKKRISNRQARQESIRKVNMIKKGEPSQSFIGKINGTKLNNGNSAK